MLKSKEEEVVKAICHILGKMGKIILFVLVSFFIINIFECPTLTIDFQNHPM